MQSISNIQDDVSPQADNQCGASFQSDCLKRESIPFFEKKKVALVVLAALLVFYVASSCFLAVKYAEVNRTPTGDAVGYEAMVHQLLTKGTYGYKAVSNARITPGYPFFLAAIFKMTGHEQPGSWPYGAVAGVQIICMTGAFVLIYLLGSLLGNRRIGLAAVAFMMLYLPVYFAPLHMITEPLSFLTFIAYVYVQMLALKKDTWPWHLFSGLMLGCAAMVRPSVAIVAPFFYLYYFFFRFKTKKRRIDLVKYAAIAILGWLLVFSPWIARNVIVFHSPDVFTTDRDDPILAGVDPYYYEMGPNYTYSGPTYQEFIQGKVKGKYEGMTKADRAYQAMGDHFKSSPFRMGFWMFIAKPVRMLTEPWIIPAKGMFKTVFLFGNYLFVGIGMLGAILSVKRKRFLPITIAFFVGLGSLILVSPESRFTFSFLPLLALLAGMALISGWDGAKMLHAAEQEREGSTVMLTEEKAKPTAAGKDRAIDEADI